MTTSADSRRAGALIFAGSVQLMLGISLAEELYPGYNVSQTISSLGVASASVSSALVFNSSLFLEGLLVLVGAYYLWRAAKNPLVSALFALGGIGAFGGALFPQDVPNIHLGISIVSFFAAGLAPFATLKLQTPPFRYFSVSMGIISFTAAVLLSMNYTLGLAYGAMERVVAYPTILWAVGFGAYLMNQGPQKVDA